MSLKWSDPDFAPYHKCEGFPATKRSVTHFDILATFFG